MLYVEFHRLRWKKKPKGELFTETTNRTAKYCQLAQPCFRLSPKPPSTRCSQTSQVEETRGREATARTAPRGDPKSARDACVRCCPAILSSHSSSRSPLWQQLWDGGAPWSCLGCSLVCSQAQRRPHCPCSLQRDLRFSPWGSQSHQCVHLSFRERLLLFLPQAGVTTFFVGLHRLLFFPLIYPGASSSSTWNFAPPSGRNLSLQSAGSRRS